MSGWWRHLLRSRRQGEGQTRLGEEEFAFTYVAFNMSISYPNGDTK